MRAALHPEWTISALYRRSVTPSASSYTIYLIALFGSRHVLYPLTLTPKPRRTASPDLSVRDRHAAYLPHHDRIVAYRLTNALIST